jgi:hypothetical protein
MREGLSGEAPSDPLPTRGQGSVMGKRPGRERGCTLLTPLPIRKRG